MKKFWTRFIDAHESNDFLNPRLYDTMRVGSNSDHADLGAALILENRKTATSSHISEYGDHTIPPFVGALSIVLDGTDQPVAVVQTIEVVSRKLADLDEAFARDYGEWDLSVETLKSKLEEYYRTYLTSWDSEMELLCERFRVVYSEK